jgi:hypothetical protein
MHFLISVFSSPLPWYSSLDLDLSSLPNVDVEGTYTASGQSNNGVSRAGPTACCPVQGRPSPCQLLRHSCSVACQMLLSFSALLAIGAVILAFALRPSRYAKLPPGPRGIPVLGNLLQLPANFAFLKLHEWSKSYGPIFSLNVAGQRIVVVCGVKVAADVLDRASGVTSSRPPWIKLNQFLNRYHNVISTQQGERSAMQ